MVRGRDEQSRLGLGREASRSAEELETLVHAAHAALWHWSRAGGPLNRLRGLTLLAKVHLLAGNAELAEHYAQLGLALSAELAADMKRGEVHRPGRLDPGDLARLDVELKHVLGLT